MKKRILKERILQKAQSSVEVIIILGLAIFVLSFLASSFYSQMQVFDIQQQQRIGSEAVRVLSKAIDDAYFLGPGTVKTVTVTLPDMIDFNKSFVSGKSVVLSVGGTEYASSTSVEARGSWPGSDGSYVFTITSFGDFVSVFAQNVYFSPAQINASIKQSGSTDLNITAVNSSFPSLLYDLSIEFPNSGNGEAVLSTTLSNPLTFLSRASTIVPLHISCANYSFGSYSGRLVFVPRNLSDENLSVPVKVICSSVQKSLVLLPSSKQISVSSSSSSVSSLLVCNNSNSLFSSAASSVSGAIAPYVSVNFSGDVNSDSCRTVVLSITAPSSPGLLTGSVSVSSSGLIASSDVNLLVT